MIDEALIERPDASTVIQARPGTGEDLDARRSAIAALRAAFRRVQDEVARGGWLLLNEPAVRTAESFVVRYAMLRDGIVVSECGFAIGPGPAVAFGRPAHRAVTGALDAMGEVEFHRLIETWAREVQAGIGHRWRHEARVRGQRGEGPGD